MDNHINHSLCTSLRKVREVVATDLRDPNDRTPRTV